MGSVLIVVAAVAFSVALLVFSVIGGGALRTLWRKSRPQ
jgi:hypothetical protein